MEFFITQYSNCGTLHSHEEKTLSDEVLKSKLDMVATDNIHHESCGIMSGSPDSS